MSDSKGHGPGWCIHYRARNEGDTCLVGVRYDRFRPGREPCFMDRPPSDTDICWDVRPPTAEEIAAHKAGLKVRMGALLTVLASIQPWRKKHKGENFGEVVVCEACGGKLHLTIAKTNGHVHGRCETPGCVVWME